MKEYVQKVRILTESLPYIKDFAHKTVVIKYGGTALKDENVSKTIIEDIALMKYIGIKPVIVHGGGVEITELLNKTGQKSEFVDGLRVTDSDTAKVVQMVLGAKVNKKIVHNIQKHGVQAVGLTGTDANLFEVQKICPNDKDLGFIGEVTNVNTKVLNLLIENDYIPIIAPVATDIDGNIFNINADYAALAVAASLKAEKLVFLTDVEGVMRDKFDPTSVISLLKVGEIEKYIQEKIIEGGMIPKVHSCKCAIEKGVKTVHILDGRLEHSLLLEIFTQHGIGTMVEK